VDKIPFEERRVIDELVGLWQTRYEPRDLVTHIDRLSGTWGSGIGASFFRQVYEDLRTNKRDKYATSSSSEFKRFLEAEYNQQAQVDAERQAQAQAKADAERQLHAQAKAKEREEFKRRARAEFEALGKVMAKVTTRAELVELGRKRTKLALYTGISYVYTNHCWNCQSDISSEINARCPACRFYICSSCASCFCNRADNPFLDIADDVIL
jgi:hypothetical protein